MKLSELLRDYDITALNGDHFLEVHAGGGVAEGKVLVVWSHRQDLHQVLVDMGQEVVPWSTRPGVFSVVDDGGHQMAFTAWEKAKLVPTHDFRFKVRLEVEVRAPTSSEAAGRAFDYVKQAPALTFDVESVSPDLVARDKITVINKENHNA